MGPRLPRDQTLRLALVSALAATALTGIASTGATSAGAPTQTGAVFTNAKTTTGSFSAKTSCVPTNPYPASVTALNPTLYYRFGEAAGAGTVADISGTAAKRGTVRTSSPTAGVANPLVFGAANSGLVWCDTTGLTSPQIPGGLSSGSFVVWTTARPNLNTVTVMAWVRTTSTTGGRIMGQSSSTWAKSVHYDRQIMIDNTGRAVFAVYPGAAVYVRSAVAVNDGVAHFLVGSVGPAGLKIYVDGVLSASDPTTTTAETYTGNETVNSNGSGGTTPNGSGYWRVGWDNLNAWGAVQPTDFGPNAVIDEAALFESTQLTDAQVASLWAANHW